ncbi:ribonuclease D [Aliiglaciecola sp. 3_MG-2023]|uniref:ribonuclease D n=1 Tax=Aliiglaciecola sp. 3_MG-2023 TaxID=3062644 RepID=UPI0026E416CA|nr:ribonuclease D [Aliiglaciecola sp. 3_MG-2023]MDO6694680.1 ribonuclease D [Aliiglaciecola sp. 3_MG-2023]
MQYTLITSFEALQSFCDQASNASAIAVDTEFVRTRTLYPKLGLIQVFDGVSLVLIDPLEIDDLSPLVDLFANPDVVKVLHSCSEDLETFWHSLKVIPTPIFDSQFAACLLNMGATLGYANLIELMLDIKLDKGESRTDWIARPLSKEQCQYAANDVLYLLQIYPQLSEQIAALGRTEWIYQEMRQLALKKSINLPAELAYLNIKNNWKLSGISLYLLKILAKWRIEQARIRDLALNFVVRESNLVEVARTLPSHKGAIFAIDGMTPQEARIHSEALLSLVEEAKLAPVEVYPPPVERLITHKGFKKASAEIRALCQLKADELEIPVEVIGSKKQIQQLLKYHWHQQDELREMGLKPDLMQGWREELLGDEALKIVAKYGEIR